MKTVYVAAIAALIAAVCTAGAAGRHHHRHHHGHPATVAQHHNLVQAFGYYEPERVHPSSEGGGGGYWNGLRFVPTRESQLWLMEHPDNQWMPFCFSNSYAECGRNSAKNFQRAGDY